MTALHTGHAAATALDVADWFLRNPCPGEAITHLKLQKLIYYAQAWSLALLDRPIFSEEIQAWAHGPVIPSIYRAAAGCGWNQLRPMNRAPYPFTEDQSALLYEVARIYGAYPAKSLELMTHNEQPWVNAREGLSPEQRSNNVIPKQHMKDFYKELHARTNG